MCFLFPFCHFPLLLACTFLKDRSSRPNSSSSINPCFYYQSILLPPLSQSSLSQTLLQLLGVYRHHSRVPCGSRLLPFSRDREGRIYLGSWFGKFACEASLNSAAKALDAPHPHPHPHPEAAKTSAARVRLANSPHGAKLGMIL